jgi:short-subunit dehydrogenase
MSKGTLVSTDCSDSEPLASASVRPLAVVTGPLSGIGYQLARKFAQAGYDLLIVSDNAAKLAAAAEQLVQHRE